MSPLSNILPDAQQRIWPLLQSVTELDFVLYGGTAIALQLGHDRACLTDDSVLRVASLLDLMATKLVVIQKRVDVKDYFDVAAMLAAGVPLRDGLARAREMYGNAFQPAESLKAMVYFQEGDFIALTPKDRSALIEAARSFTA